MSLNKAMLIGNLGRDPEIKYLQTGTTVATFSLGTNEKYKDKNGETKETVEWHNITCFGKLAEIVGEYLSKGSHVYIEGSIRTEKWEDKDGNKRQTTKIRAQKLEMLGGQRKKEEREAEPGPDEEVPF